MDKISFNGSYHFLQNQVGLPCAMCGRRIIADIELKKLAPLLSFAKGKEVADILTPYLDSFETSAGEPIFELVNLAKEGRFESLSLKNLALHLKSKNICKGNLKDVLGRLFDSILYSADHVVPKSEGGINNYANYLPMHRKCNSGRYSESYASLAEKKPDFLYNLQNTLEEINRRIISDKTGSTHYHINLPADYVSKVSESLAAQGVNITNRLQISA